MARSLAEWFSGIRRRLSRSLDTEWVFTEPRWLTRLSSGQSNHRSGQVPPTRVERRSRQLDVKDQDTLGESSSSHRVHLRHLASSRPFPGPKIVPEAKIGNAAKWIGLAEFVLNIDFGGAQESGRVSKRVLSISEYISEISDPQSPEYVAEVKYYLEEKGLNPADFNQQALRRIREKYERDELGPKSTLPWW